MFLRFYCVSILIFVTAIAVPAQLNIDSLKASLSESSRDSNRVKTLNLLAWNLRSINPEAAMGYALQSERLAQEIHYDKGRGDAFNHIGVLHYRRGEYPEAVKAHLQALTIREMTGDQTGIASSHINLGNIYKDQANNKAAIDHYLLAANILENSNDIGRLTLIYLNIGVVFYSENKNDESLIYSEKAKASAIKCKDKASEAQAMNNIGVIYEERQRYDDALTAYKASFATNQSLGNRREMADNMMNIGHIYLLENDFSAAVDWHKRAETEAREISYLEGLCALYKDFATDYETAGDYKTALAYYIRHKDLSDSLFNEENETTINSLTDKWENDRNEKNFVLQQEALRTKQEESRTGEQRMWLMTSGGIIILLFLAYAFYASARMKRAKLVIETQHNELAKLKAGKVQ